MIPEPTSQQELDDREKRTELQTKLQEAVRRSASSTEIRKIEEQIGEVNRRLESYAARVKKPPIP